MKLLLVEDSADLAHWVSHLLETEHFAVDWAPDGEQAEIFLRTKGYDAVLLDLRLPRLSGRDVLMRLRRAHDTVPVLMLTAHGATDDKVACFAAGADDYVVKPFDARELIARIRAIIRRRVGGDRPESVFCGDLEYRFETGEFLIADHGLVLRGRERAILETQMLRQGKTVSKVALTQCVSALGEEPSADAIDIYIHRLRKHLVPSTAQIVTLRGLGHILRSK